MHLRKRYVDLCIKDAIPILIQLAKIMIGFLISGKKGILKIVLECYHLRRINNEK